MMPELALSRAVGARKTNRRKSFQRKKSGCAEVQGNRARFEIKCTHYGGTMDMNGQKTRSERAM